MILGLGLETCIGSTLPLYKHSATEHLSGVFSPFFFFFFGLYHLLLEFPTMVRVMAQHCAWPGSGPNMGS